MKLNWVERLVVNNPLRAWEQRAELARFRKWQTLRPGATVLEVGCGRGIGAGLIRKAFQPACLHALDLDRAMLRKAAGYWGTRNSQGIFFLAGDASRLPLKTESVDAVFGFGVLHHVVDWRSSLAEIARVLKGGGLYFIEELYPTLYQNAITRRILLHPAEDRFRGPDLRQALVRVNLDLQTVFEMKWLGLLGVATKVRDPRP